MIKDLRIFLAKILIGDMSFAKNLVIDGKIGCRPDYFVGCCVFIGKNSKAESSGKIIFPEQKTGE